VVRRVWTLSSTCRAVAFSVKIGVPVKPKSWDLGKKFLMVWWVWPNWER